MTTIRAHFDGKVFVPDEPVNLPVGTRSTIQLESVSTAAPSSANSLDELAKLAEEFPETDLPSDAAAQHDHYLYGHPKRS